MVSEINWQYEARKTWTHLVRAAKKHETLFYADLALKIGQHHRHVDKALGPIQEYCLYKELPALTVLVINKRSHKPGRGFIGATPEKIEEEFIKVCEEDWTLIRNPFELNSGNDFHLTDQNLAKQLVTTPDKAENILQLVKTRGRAQAIFRKALLSAYDNKCAFCGFSFPEALDAAHIVPWDLASRDQRINPQNGLLLCANHHRLFDSEWISVSSNYVIEYCDLDDEYGPYSEADKSASTSLHGKKIRLPKNKALWPQFP